MAKQKKWKDKYEVLSELGEGGNAKVYQVRLKESGEIYALKELQAGGREKKGRFADEINIIIENSEEIEGIIPIIEYSFDEYWYTMPIAKPIVQFIIERKLTIRDIVDGTIQLCSTLEKLHEKGVSHRDIKPSNIYYYEGRFCLGDFGLVDFPENGNDFTRSDRGLGAIFTIAPEMKRNPKESDGKKADIFSLAKTMWMFFTEDEKGFDGVYNYLDPSHSLRYFEKYKNEHIVEIEELFKDATDNNPVLRPTIKEFKQRLIDWISIYEDVHKSQASDWNFLSKQLFGSNAPDSSSWKDINKIVDILNVIGRTPAYNHMLFHDQGGLDFSHAEFAAETGCIKMYDTIGFCYIVKPKRLYFEGFGNDFRWNYFLLELAELTPILENNDSEYLVEDSPAHYVSARYAQYGVYDYESGIPLPEGFQTVYRYTKGKFLIVMKDGPYNGINGTYDGRHGAYTATGFREYIDHLEKLYDDIYRWAKDDDKWKELPDNVLEERILNLEEFNNNPVNHEDQEWENKNNSKNQEKYREQKKSRFYIRQEYINWNFSDIVQEYHQTKESAIKFAFKFECPDSDSSLGNLLEKTNNYICIDGNIRKLNAHSDDNCFYVYDRDVAIEYRNKFEERIKEYLKNNGMVELNKYESCFSVELIKCGKPIHLFTKQEIEKVMRDADDRFRNQLVIDENGYVKVIQDDNIRHLFPVRHEPWDAGKNYVGKYSDLLTLNDEYISSLQGWLLYLQTGRKQYIDYVRENVDEEGILAEIGEYY